MISLIIHIAGALIGVLLGFLLRERKCYGLMKKYNSANLEERLEMPVEQMANDYGITLYIISALMIVVSIVSYFTSPMMHFLLVSVEMLIISVLSAILVVKYEFRPHVRKAKIAFSVFLNCLLVVVFVVRLVS